MTIRQQIFIRKYLEYKNATKAVMEIYDTTNKKSAAVIGSKLLRMANIKSEIQQVIEANNITSTSKIELIKNILTNHRIKDKIGLLKFYLYLTED